MRLKVFLWVAFSFGIIGLTNGQSAVDGWEGFQEGNVSSTELEDWKIYGQGKAFAIGDQFCLKEDDETKGAMLISPKAYKKDVVLKFKVLALTASSVVAVVLSGSDPGKSDSLTIPSDYDGSFNLWYEEKDNYFFAFKNAPHGFTPFVRKNSAPGIILASAPENKMVAGVYYDVEVGRKDNKLWLSINDEEVFMVEDEDPLSGGHVALRIRGTAGFTGGCLVKDLIIYSN